MKVTISEQFENGDPGAPEGCIVYIFRDDREVCSIWFPNEDNEDIQELIEKLLVEHFGAEISRTSNIDPDYGCW